MRKGFIYLFFTALLLIFQINCTRVSTENSNSADVNSLRTNNTAVVVSKTPKVEETPLPEFTDAETALAEGKKLLEENKTEKSIEALRQAIKLNPELADAHFNLGIALALVEREQENTQVVTEEETARNTNQKKPVAKKNKKGKKEEPVDFTPSQKSFDEAAKIYEKITKKEPKNDAAFYNLGRSLNKLNEDEEAEKAFRQAVKLKPDDLDYQTELGAILIKLSEYEEAVKVLKGALKIDESNVYLQELLAKAEAGEKRINFGIKPKLPQEQMQPQQARTGRSQPTTSKPRQRPTPSLKLEEKPLPKSSTDQ
jgi:tetratricopeptide (TPR) repeat protein